MITSFILTSITQHNELILYLVRGGSRLVRNVYLHFERLVYLHLLHTHLLTFFAVQLHRPEEL